jgi:hypothetical protein
MEEPTPLTVPEIARLLRSSTTAIDAEVQAASPDVVGWHPAPSEWCVKEVLGHLIEADRRGFAGRIQVLLDGENPELVGWDQEEVATGRRDCERDARELLREFLGQRERGLRVLDGLAPADLARSGRHPRVGELSVGDVVSEWVHHDRNHLKQILSNVQAYVWPQMGAAQGFSGE